MFEKFAENPLTAWVAFGSLIALGGILVAISRAKGRWTAKVVASGALCIALAFVLSCVRLFRMPTGGSVTPASMLPIMLFAVAYGAGPGLLAGMAYGLLQYLQGGWWLNGWQFLLDYVLAFAALGMAGVVRGRKDAALFAAIPFAALLRAVCAVLAGLMWMADATAAELVIGSWQFSTPLAYSLVYNGLYLVPDTAICVVVAALVGKRMVGALAA